MVKYDRLILKGLLVHVNTRVDLHVKLPNSLIVAGQDGLMMGNIFVEFDIIIRNWVIGVIMNKRKNKRKKKGNENKACILGSSWPIVKRKIGGKHSVT